MVDDLTTDDGQPRTFMLAGDITHPGMVEVEAETLEEAVKKAEDGDFVVFSEQSNCLTFKWDGEAQQ